MGNHPSRSFKSINSLDSISKPKSLSPATDAGPAYDGKDDYQTPVSRQFSARVSSSTYLAVPTAGNHRRSRSALARSSSPAPSNNRDSAPPPYAVAVSDGARSSNTLAVPQPSALPNNQENGASIVERRASTYVPHPQVPDGVPEMQTSTRRAEELRRPMRQNSVENALDTLRKYNTVIIVDDSGSMEGARWREARDALAALADIASKYDADGVDICFLNNKHVGNNMRDSQLIRRLFDHVRPQGITPIGEKLEQLLLYYLDTLEHAKARADAGDARAMKMIKPVNYIVITDGAPTDDPEAVIVAAARRLDAHNFPLTQVGIQFVQIGNSPDATAFLDELDNGLTSQYGVRDIVDTTPYTGGQLSADIIIKILLGGINRRVDRRGGQSVI